VFVSQQDQASYVGSNQVINPIAININKNTETDNGLAKFTVQPHPYLLGGKILLSALL